MRKIEVEYNGDYPVACMGRLKIKVDGEEVYNKEFCCTSSGSVWFDENWDEHVDWGELTWDDASDFEQDIQDAVQCELDKVHVCCGGCV